MNDVRKRKSDGAVWIPLRAIQKIEERGTTGSVGYREEFFGVGSLAVSNDKKDQADKLGWMDVGISHDHGSYVQDGRYVASDIYEPRPGDALGQHLVLQQHINRDERREWHLHQD